MLDNRDRVKELNQLLLGKAKISELPVIMEQVPILDPGRLIFSRKTAQIANPSILVSAFHFPLTLLECK